MSTNYTANYNLNQWQADDQVVRTEFNADNQKIDAALSDLNQTINQEVAALNQGLAITGNCRMVLGSYVGTGEFGSNKPTVLTFPSRPLLVYIHGMQSCWMLYGCNQAQVFLTGNSNVMTTWSGNTLSWYDSNSQWAQMNVKDAVYPYVAVYLTK